MKKYIKFSLLRGFTLIEIIMVISIMSILSSMLIPLYKVYVDKAKNAKVLSIGQTICAAAIWSLGEQKNFGNPIKIKTDIEEITDLNVQEVPVIYDSTVKIFFSYDRKNYVLELNTSSHVYVIRDRDKGSVIYE